MHLNKELIRVLVSYAKPSSSYLSVHQLPANTACKVFFTDTFLVFNVDTNLHKILFLS